MSAAAYMSARKHANRLVNNCGQLEMKIKAKEEMNAIVITADGRMPLKSAARYLGLSHRSLQDRRLKGLPPRAVKVGGRCFYRLEELDAFIANGGVA